MAQEMAMLHDVARCSACRACMVACKQWHDLPADMSTPFEGQYQSHAELTPSTWNLIKMKERVDALILIGDAAMRFRDAACAAGFPEENIYAAGYSMPRAVELAHACAHAGEVVLLSPACASFDMYDGMAQRGRDFKRLVRALPHAVSEETAESGGEA